MVAPVDQLFLMRLAFPFDREVDLKSIGAFAPVGQSVEEGGIVRELDCSGWPTASLWLDDLRCSVTASASAVGDGAHAQLTAPTA